MVERYKNAGVTIEGGAYGKALNREWPVTDCFFGGSWEMPTEQRIRLDRPYCQIDKYALRDCLIHPNVEILPMNHASKAVGLNLYSPTGSLVHDAEGSTVTLQSKDGTESATVRTKLIVDTTGHETQLVLRDVKADGNRPPGFQIAYGCLVDIDEEGIPDPTKAGPYDKEAMTLFDYRTDHFDNANDGDDVATRAFDSPTFVYVMPQKDNKVFFEETSLVARPALSFQECKDRCMTRLEYLGIKVKDIEEEEFCYIPMGGSLPAKGQRIIGVGGAAAMVHPSTGYHLCRMMMGASDAVRTIEEGLANNYVPDKIAASVYHSIWSVENIKQRNFAVFGGEFLMEQNVQYLRGFFDGFFRMPLDLWAGFLAGWPGLPNNDKHETWYKRLWFGLNLVARTPPQVTIAMAAAIAAFIVEEGPPLVQSVTPFLGDPPSFEYEDYLAANVGDVAVKAEARRIIQASKVTEDLPSAFGEEAETDETDTVTDGVVVVSVDSEPEPEHGPETESEHGGETEEQDPPVLEAEVASDETTTTTTTTENPTEQEEQTVSIE